MTEENKDKLVELAIKVASLNHYGFSREDIHPLIWEARVLVREIRGDTHSNQIRREVGSQ